ncbi:MAG: 2,3-bisphosphoglycerate-dependent phosphoglycerate mutase [Thermoleophilaceae bacterium]|nr:2,3-bisphosphoglycerate-dependent phosphoglycerate mutase [Thermoleophilaceae bacterium]
MIWLARHGETAANAEGRVQGRLDPPLNERGREQARALAREAEGLGLRTLYSSQLARARETADTVGGRVGLEPVVDERLAESNRGSWEGRLLREIEREDPDAWHAWQRAGSGFRFPGGGESLEEHVARVDAALADVAAGELPALVVCHGGTVRCALVARGGRSLDEFTRIAVPNASLVKVEA